MTGTREHAHELIDRLPETQLSALVGLLETIVDPIAAALHNAPIDDEPESDEEKQAVAEARDRLKRNGGKGIPHEEAMRRLGLGDRAGVEASRVDPSPPWKTWRRSIRASPAASSRPSSASPKPERAI